ncbi:MAG TPA: hypothetical protein VN673_02420 [Clostridia bacterium]|nr:hypothetical protein [Clostridia bacterium]
MFNATRTGSGLEQYSIEELASSYDDKGYTGLHSAACFGHLDKIAGGVTAAELAAVKRSDDSETALHTAAGFGHLNQIKGGVTAEQLLSAPRQAPGGSALHRAAMYCHLDQIKDGVTADQLAADGSGSHTSLHAAARAGALDQIKDGVSVTDVLALNLPGVFEEALNAGHLDQFKGGTSLAQLNMIKSERPNETVAISVLRILITASGKVIENTLVGCPDAARQLNESNSTHMNALRKALTRNRAIQPFLTSGMTAAML